MLRLVLLNYVVEVAENAKKKRMRQKHRMRGKEMYMRNKMVE